MHDILFHDVSQSTEAKITITKNVNVTDVSIQFSDSQSKYLNKNRIWISSKENACTMIQVICTIYFVYHF